jgi:hypothetical protein
VSVLVLIPEKILNRRHQTTITHPVELQVVPEFSFTGK